MGFVGLGPAKRPPAPGHITLEEGLDEKWLMAQYLKFNLDYFDLKLPLDIKLYFRGKRKGFRLGTAWGHAGCFRGITINPYRDRDQILRTLLHEMVHAEQFVVRKSDGDHGRWFKSRCRELTVLTKKQYGVVA
jgi:hypothetical protein